MGFSSLTAAAGIFDSSSTSAIGPIQTESVPLNWQSLPGAPIFVAATWENSGYPVVTDSALNTYLPLAELSGIQNLAALFVCNNPQPPLQADGAPLTISVNMGTPVHNLFLAPFDPFVVASPMINSPPGIQTATFSGITNPSITTNLPHAYDTVIAVIYGQATNQVVSSGWSIVQSSPKGASVLLTTPSQAGTFIAQPATYPSAPPISMILFSMPPTANVGMVRDNNGIFLAQGLTELRPEGDTIASLQSAAGWNLPFCCGETLRPLWSDIQPNIPTGNPSVDYDWSYIDAALSLAQQNGMFINIILDTGDETPAWIMNSGIPIFNSSRTGQSPFPCPWDPIYQFFLQQLVTQLASRYDGNPYLADITISGFGWHDGMAFCRTADDNALLAEFTFDGLSGEALLYSAFQQICLMYAYAFRKTRLSVVFFSPIFPNNQTTETAAIPWIQWLFGLGNQFGIQYHNYTQSVDLQDAIPEALIFDYSGTNTGFAQPQHASPSDWTSGLYNIVALTRAHCCETYIGQLQADSGLPNGFNSQLAVVMLQYVAANWKSFTPQPIPVPPAPKPVPVPVSLPTPPPPVLYTTVYGDTFDLISFKIFGTEAYRSNFVDANPAYSPAYIFDSGIQLVVPTITTKATMIRPPW